MRIIFSAFLSLAIPSLLMAQAVKQHVPVVTLGRIHASEIINGRPEPVATTRQEMLKYGLLLADVNNCKIVEYKFSMIAPGQPYYGPVYISGDELTDSLKNKIKLQDGPNVKVYIEEIKVNYRGNEMMVNNLAFKYDK